MKIFHEAPLSIFSEVQARTDGDYALCHLLEKNAKYAETFLRARANKREIILDNSLYELDESVGWELLDKWVWALNPAWFILPDARDNYSLTVFNAQTYLKDFEIPQDVKTVAVCQGTTYKELAECYRQLEPLVDLIAINFRPYWGYIDKDDHWSEVAELRSLMTARILLINRLEEDGILNIRKPHHLLGCALPQEFVFHVGRPYIRSVDTSSPVMYGLEYGLYPEHGPKKKAKDKLCDHIDDQINAEQRYTILKNMAQFRKWCSR